MPDINKVQQTLPDKDTQLMINVRDHDDHTSFVILLHRFKRRISSYIYKRINSSSDTEELCQEVFARLWQCRHKFSSKGRFQPYLFGIAANVVGSFNRRKFKEQNAISIEYASDCQIIEIQKKLNELSQPQDRLVAEELLKDADDAIANLPIKYRIVFKLIVEQGYTIKQTSEQIRCSEASVRRCYHLSVRKLRWLLAPKEHAPQ